MDQGLVTPHAVLPGDPPVPGGDLDRFLEVLEGEGDRVTEAVLGLGDPLGETVGQEVTLHAGRRMAMAALEPGVVLLVHDVNS